MGKKKKEPEQCLRCMYRKKENKMMYCKTCIEDFDIKDTVTPYEKHLKLERTRMLRELDVAESKLRALKANLAQIRQTLEEMKDEQD